jgi:hypothetical protein
VAQSSARASAGTRSGARGQRDRIAELQLENLRLRRLVTDLLLEKIKFEEAVQSHSSVARRDDTSTDLRTSLAIMAKYSRSRSPAAKQRVIQYFQERMPYGLFVPDVP